MRSCVKCWLGELNWLPSGFSGNAEPPHQPESRQAVVHPHQLGSTKIRSAFVQEQRLLVRLPVHYPVLSRPGRVRAGEQHFSNVDMAGFGFHGYKDTFDLGSS